MSIKERIAEPASLKRVIKEAVYNKIADYLSIARGYFIASLYGPSWARMLAKAEESLRDSMQDRLVRLRENYAYAERVLAKWRKNRPDWAYSAQEKIAPNPNCEHLKGGRLKRIVKDYNVTAHTFTSGKIKIWCLNNCGFESYYKDGNWEQAVRMIEESSNTPSASERFFLNKVTHVAVKEESNV